MGTFWRVTCLSTTPLVRTGGVTVSTGILDAEPVGVESRAEGGIVAQVCLDHPDLVLRPTYRRASDVSITPDYWTTIETGERIGYFTATGQDGEFDGFETALSIDHTVSNPVLVDRYPNRRVYRMTVSDDVVEFVDKTADVGGRIIDRTSSPEGWLVTLRLPNRNALSTFNDRCRAHDISLNVSHLRIADDCEDGVVALTPKQEDLLCVAYEEGYFDVPRGITQDELADRLGVSKSAISQRLRRAMTELCAEALP